MQDIFFDISPERYAGPRVSHVFYFNGRLCHEGRSSRKEHAAIVMRCALIFREYMIAKQREHRRQLEVISLPRVRL